MNGDPLNDLMSRVEVWQSHASSMPTLDGLMATRGWCLCQHLKRLGESASAVHDQMMSRLISQGTGKRPITPPAFDSATVDQMISIARSSFSSLISLLDQESDEPADTLEPAARHAFLDLCDALFVANHASLKSEEIAQGLFNQVIQDIYALEPAADLAAALRPRLIGQVSLANLLCTAVAGYAPAMAPASKPEAIPAAREVDQPLPEFMPVEAFICAGAGSEGPIHLEELARRLARSSWYFVQWGVHRLRLLVHPATRTLRLEVHDPSVTVSLSKGMDGWEARLETGGRSALLAVIQSGHASIRLPDRIEVSQFAISVRRPGQVEYAPVFARTKP